MKLLSLILSSLVFMISAYFFVVDFKLSAEMNYIVYMSMLLILMCICIIGMVVNVSLIRIGRKRVNTLIYNSYSQKRIKNKSFDRQFEIL